MIESLTIEWRAADETQLEIVVRPTFTGGPMSGKALLGFVRGPFCDTARTLTSEFLLQSTDEGVLTTVIVDPCYWTDELPMEYEVVVQLQDGDRVLNEYTTRAGFRRAAKRVAEE